MTDHLTSEQRAHYRQNTLPPEEIADVYVHLEMCETCRASVQADQVEAALPPVPFADFQVERLLGAWNDAAHLTDEQQAAYVDGTLDRIERQMVESHLEICSQCVEEVRQLRSFRALLSTYPTQELSPTRPLSLMERLAALLGPSPFRSALSLSGAAVAGALLFAIFVHLPGQRQEESEARESLSRMLADARNSAVQERAAALLAQQQVEQEQKARRAIQAEKAKAQQALETERKARLLAENQLVPGAVLQDKQGQILHLQPILPPEDLLQSLHPKGGVTAGSDRKPRFVLQSPRGRVLLTDRPAFSWTRAKGATHYQVAINPTSGSEPPRLSGKITVTGWTADKPLRRGQTYQWSVTALRGQEELAIVPGPSDPPSLFYILPEGQARLVQEAEHQKTLSPLDLGAVYLNAGMLVEAQKQFLSARAKDPGSPVVKKLLATVSALLVAHP